MPQRAEGSIEIDAPIEIVYRYWETLENLPSFMDNVEEVAPTGTDTTHWKVKGPFGRVLDWEARTTQKEPNNTIAWTTTDGEAGTSGQVRFREAGEQQTYVEVQMLYADLLGGKVGEVASRIVANPRWKRTCVTSRIFSKSGPSRRRFRSAPPQPQSRVARQRSSPPLRCWWGLPS